MKDSSPRQTAMWTSVATAIVTLAQAFGLRITSSTGHTAIVGGAVAVLAIIIHSAGTVTKGSTAKTVTMFDTITPEDIPPNAQAIAGYINGRWPSFYRAEHAFPKARLVSISVTADENAMCLDVENGDATPEQVPGWVIRQHKCGLKRPWVYCNRSTLPAVLKALQIAGIDRSSVVIWTADPTNKAHITKGADATQWGWHALGRNLDISLVKLSAFDE